MGVGFAGEQHRGLDLFALRGVDGELDVYLALGFGDAAFDGDDKRSRAVGKDVAAVTVFYDGPAEVFGRLFVVLVSEENFPAVDQRVGVFGVVLEALAVLKGGVEVFFELVVGPAQGQVVKIIFVVDKGEDLKDFARLMVAAKFEFHIALLGQVAHLFAVHAGDGGKGDLVLRQGRQDFRDVLDAVGVGRDELGADLFRVDLVFGLDGGDEFIVFKHKTY